MTLTAGPQLRSKRGAAEDAVPRAGTLSSETMSGDHNIYCIVVRLVVSHAAAATAPPPPAARLPLPLTAAPARSWYCRYLDFFITIEVMVVHSAVKIDSRHFDTTIVLPLH